MGLSLSEYITKIGPQKFSELLGVTEHTAYNWKNKKSIPGASTAWEIIKLSHGLLTWESIYQPYFPQDEIKNCKDEIDPQLSLPLETR